MSGRKLAAALVAILLLAIVLPVVVATQVNARRVAQAQDDVRRIAQETRLQGPAVLAGEGAAPKSALAMGWLDAKAGSARVPPDPWGNQYLIVVSANPPAVTVLSAGPNGIVETGFSEVGTPTGDDICYQSRR